MGPPRDLIALDFFAELAHSSGWSDGDVLRGQGELKEISYLHGRRSKDELG